MVANYVPKTGIGRASELFQRTPSEVAPVVGKLVELNDLKTYFFTEEGVVRAVDGVSFHINQGETLGVVGESGCGKSVTALSVLRLIPSPPGRIVGGDILFEGESILRKSDAQMRDLRGNSVAMIFQEPMTSLNPVFTCGDQIAEAIEVHQGLPRREALDKAVEMLRLVGISLPERRIREYPHQLSGGMRQRVMIGMALSCNPRLLMADEPTTALDVTIQAQILELMKELKKELGMAIMLITHDLGVVADMAQRVVVMYAGKVVEEADVVSLFRRPLHPYSEGLLNSIPRLNRPKGRLHVIAGQVPNPVNLPPGCHFSPRCSYAESICREREPKLLDVGDGRLVSCWVRAGGSREEVA
jgi:oligopeptide/dipeptide ABC transporter ATP-binding protein